LHPLDGRKSHAHTHLICKWEERVRAMWERLTMFSSSVHRAAYKVRLGSGSIPEKSERNCAPGEQSHFSDEQLPTFFPFSFICSPNRVARKIQSNVCVCVCTVIYVYVGAAMMIKSCVIRSPRRVQCMQAKAENVEGILCIMILGGFHRHGTH